MKFPFFSYSKCHPGLGTLCTEW